MLNWFGLFIFGLCVAFIYTIRRLDENAGSRSLVSTLFQIVIGIFGAVSLLVFIGFFQI